MIFEKKIKKYFFAKTMLHRLFSVYQKLFLLFDNQILWFLPKTKTLQKKKI